MIKIVVTGTRGFPGTQGGIENHCEKLYTHLVPLGCDIIVFTRKPYVSSNLNSYKNVSLISLSCPKNKFLETIVHTFKSVIKAKQLRPDILHIHAVGPSLFAPLARLLGMKVVVTSHGADYERKKWSSSAKIFLRFCEWMGMTFASEIISIAKYISDDMKRKFGRNAFTIPNGVEIPTLADTDDSIQAFKLQKQKYVLAVGRFVPEKGFDDLIEAFDKGDFGEWKLAIVGDADHEDKYSTELKIKASENGNVVLTGFLRGKRLHELYSHAGLFVLPSYHEGLPIVLLEAMSYGLTCIASSIPANRNVELVEERYFEAGDINALAEKISEFINKPWGEDERRKQIDTVAVKYNWKNIADQTLEVYKNVLS